jgi:GAF domain-containing protein
MFTVNTSLSTDDKSLNYKNLSTFLTQLLGEERDPIANMANMASFLYFNLPNINWSGFYIFDGKELVLGPFLGKPACVRIQIGKGVCGTSAMKKEPVLVENVHEFPGHIACDIDSKSEIVLPIVINDRMIAVLDIDSPLYSRFDIQDLEGLSALLQILLTSTDFTRLVRTD